MLQKIVLLLKIVFVGFFYSLLEMTVSFQQKSILSLHLFAQKGICPQVTGFVFYSAHEKECGSSLKPTMVQESECNKLDIKLIQTRMAVFELHRQT